MANTVGGVHWRGLLFGASFTRTTKMVGTCRAFPKDAHKKILSIVFFIVRKIH